MTSVYKIIDKSLGEYDMAILKHPRRRCLYDELKHCVKVGKESAEVANRVNYKYLNDGFPKNFGLFVNRFIIRRNTEKIIELNEMWWREYDWGSERDQCNRMYCVWKLGITVNPIEFKENNGPASYFRVYKHK